MREDAGYRYAPTNPLQDPFVCELYPVDILWELVESEGRG